MNVAGTIFHKNSPYWFFIKFIVAFTLLYLFFPFYWGVTGTGGKLYSPFLAEHFNFLKGFTSLLTKSAKLLLDLLGFETQQRLYNSLRIENSRGIIVNPSCLGWGVMSFWFAFVYANNGSWKYKLKWILTGISIIIMLNIFRIALIALANHKGWKIIIGLDHHQTFNIASYGCVFMLMYRYITVHNRSHKYKRNTLKSSENMSTI